MPRSASEAPAKYKKPPSTQIIVQQVGIVNKYIVCKIVFVYEDILDQAILAVPKPSNYLSALNSMAPLEAVVDMEVAELPKKSRTASPAPRKESKEGKEGKEGKEHMEKVPEGKETQDGKDCKDGKVKESQVMEGNKEVDMQTPRQLKPQVYAAGLILLLLLILGLCFAMPAPLDGLTAHDGLVKMVLYTVSTLALVTGIALLAVKKLKSRIAKKDKDS